MAIQTAHQNSFKRDDKSMAKGVEESENRVSGSFECSICLDTANDPVVTLCGHLYCWPCIYKWIQHQDDSSFETLENQNAQCPVCKTEVSLKTIVPLYGPCVRTEENSTNVDSMIPPRPPTPRFHLAGTSRISDQGSSLTPTEQVRRWRGYQRLAPSPLAMPERDHGMHIEVPSPTIVMLQEMVSGRILGDLETPLFATASSYNLVGTSSRRARWQTTQADRSLSRVYVFLLFGVVFCLLSFT